MPTARPFAYHTGAQIPGTEKYDNLSVGVTPQNYNGGYGGATWYNGADEDPGYVIAYARESLQEPGFRRTAVKSEAAFLALVNSLPARIGQTPFTTGSSAVTWLNANGFWTSFYPYPSSLLIYLDSGSASSYSGTGSTWFDLTENDSDATLFNSPAYSTAFDGILGFDDASSEYGTIPNIGDLNQWTVETWFRLTAAITSKVSSIVCNQYDLATKLNFSIGTNNAPSNYNLTVGFFDGAWRNTTGFTPSLNTWYQVVGTYDGSVLRQYVNGVANGGTLNYSGTPQSGGEIRLMRRWDGTTLQGNLIDGDLAIVKIYNSALNSTQVLENYDLNKNRFSVVLYYDPINSNSYPGSGTTIFSLVTPQYNGTLFNSPTYSSSGGGYFDFNGVNQYIGIPHNSALKPTASISTEQWISADDWTAGTSSSDYLCSLSCTQGGGYSNNMWDGGFYSYLYVSGQYRIPFADVSTFTGWHHFVTTFDGRYVRLYVDGQEVDVEDLGTSGNTISYDNDNTIMIGAEASGTTTPAGEYWDGKISITKIYNLPLSASEVLQKFNSTKSRFGF